MADVEETIENFWEVENYRRTVKRTEDGMNMCTELMKLMQDRSEIERKYAEKLKSWSKKWMEIIDKGSEYGTNKDMLKGSLMEAERVSDLHTIMKDSLLNIVSAKVKDWQKENYKTQLIGGSKPASTFADEFKKAQKPWAKQLDKVNKRKKDYHNACKQLSAAQNHEEITKASSEPSAEQNLKKAREKTAKCSKDVDTTKEKYKQSLDELNSQKAKYIEDMTLAFGKAQDFEKRRLEFFKEILYKLQETLDLSKSQTAAEIYRLYRENIDHSNPSSDLQSWADQYGVGMPMVSPTFEEYVCEMPANTNMNRQDKTKSVYASSTEHQSTGARPANLVEPAGKNPFDDNSNFQENTISPSYANLNSNTYSDNTRTQNRSVENDYINRTESVYSTINDPEPMDVHDGAGDAHNGEVLVQALYDFAGEEADELSFKAGEVFRKLKDKDSEGWCTGLKDGKVGLFPDSYVNLC